MWPGLHERSTTTGKTTHRFASEEDSMIQDGFPSVPMRPDDAGAPPSPWRRWRASLSWSWGGLAASLPWRRMAGERSGRPARRPRRWRRVVATVLLLALLCSQANAIVDSPVGAWGADYARALLGPRLTAQIESYYFGFTDNLERLRVQLFGAPQTDPYGKAQGTPLPTEVPASRHGPPPLMSLPPIQLRLAPGLPGEGQWIADGLPNPTYRGWPVPIAKTFLRPDPDRPYALVTLAAIDLRQVSLHIVDGTSEPAAGGPGIIAPPDRTANLLLAAFNGGFKAADGHFGLATGGHVYLPAQFGAATLALYADGSVRMGAWGSPDVPMANLIAYRQNGVPLIVDGVINPTAQTQGYSWGAPILANIYTWRSAVALTSSGVLLYAAGSSVSAETMAQALVRAGAEQAMELDINPVWVRFETYSGSGTSLVAHPLRKGMYGGPTQFLVPYARDFLYVTRREPSTWAVPSSGHVAGG